MILNLHLLRSLILLPLLDLVDSHLVPFKDWCSHKHWQLVEMCLRYTEVEEKNPAWLVIRMLSMCKASHTISSTTKTIILRIVINLGIEVHVLIPVLSMLRLEACCEFQSSLGYLVRPCLKEQKD